MFFYWINHNVCFLSSPWLCHVCLLYKDKKRRVHVLARWLNSCAKGVVKISVKWLQIPADWLQTNPEGLQNHAKSFVFIINLHGDEPGQDMFKKYNQFSKFYDVWIFAKANSKAGKVMIVFIGNASLNIISHIYAVGPSDFCKYLVSSKQVRVACSKFEYFFLLQLFHFKRLSWGSTKILQLTSKYKLLNV